MLPIDAPDLDDDGKPTGTTHHVARDEGLRETSLEALAGLKPVAREDGVHTAGTSSQITDGAAAVLLATAGRARGARTRQPRRVVDQCLIGVDPVLMLTGPIDATRRLFDRTGLTMDDIDTVEINEAFASVVLAWERECKPDMEKVNPNGGAIALGHPVGATGARLVTTGAARARARRWNVRARHDVLRGRARHRHDHRAPRLSTLAERLGYAPDARLLIINCDDLGSTRSANVAVYDALRNGVATSAIADGPVPVGARRSRAVPR